MVDIRIEGATKMVEQIKQLTDGQLMRYSRHIMLPSMDIDGQEKLWNSKVLVIGVGGLGCAAIQYLAVSGIGELSIADDDEVDKTNLQRQVLHTENNVAMNKCDSAKLLLSQLNSEIKINTIKQRLTGETLSEQIQQHDIVLDCTDSLMSRESINRHCFELKTPLISGAAIRMEGQVMSFSMDGTGPCYHCISGMFSEQTLTCSEAGVLSPVVGIIGAIQATEAIKTLCGVGRPLSNRLLMMDAASMQFNEFSVNKQNNCPVCGAKPKE